MTETDYWHGHFDLPNGRVIRPTRPGNVARLAERNQLFECMLGAAYPMGLTGHSVLDIGCADGYFSLTCAGAGGDVLGVDKDEHEVAKARSVAASLGARAKFAVADLGATNLPAADLVICLGLLYHLPDPVAGLDRLQRLARHALIIDTDVVPMPMQWMRVEWQAGKRWQGESSGRPVPCLIPSAAFIDAYLASVGFRRVHGSRGFPLRQWDYRSQRRAMALYLRDPAVQARLSASRPIDDGGKIFGWRYWRGTIAYGLLSFVSRLLEPWLHRWR